MPQITFFTADGAERLVDADAGVSIMRAAVSNSVPGIVGECGGQAMCATCHVYVRDEFLADLPAISDDEEEMLDCTSAPRQDNSRLGCQLRAGDAFDQIVVQVPRSQV